MKIYQSKIIAVVLSLGLVIGLATSCNKDDDKGKETVLTGINIMSTEGALPLSLTVGGEQEIIANTVPDDVPNVVFKWTSEDSNIATVSDHGTKATVTGKKAGTTNIVVTSGKVSQKVAVTVTEPKKLHLLGIASKEPMHYDYIRYYIGEKAVTLNTPLSVGIPWEYTMNIIGNDTIIFVLGHSNQDDTDEYAVLKNGSPYIVTDNSLGAMVYSVYVLGTDLYAIGQYQNGTKKVACYWKNNVKTDLPSDKDAYAYKMTIDNGNIYVTGKYITNAVLAYHDGYGDGDVYANETVPCYWRNGERTDLSINLPPEPNTYYDVSACAIGLDNSHIFITGRIKTYIITETGYSTEIKICYWNNGTYTAMANYSALGFPQLTIHNGDVYIPGTYYTDVENHTTQACYFKNGEKIDLSSNKAVIEFATSLYFDGDVMYVTGCNTSVPINSALWQDNVQTLLDSDFLPVGQMFIR